MKNLQKFNLSNYFLSSMYSEKGFLFAEINPILFPSAKDSLDIYYHINENNIVKIRQILIKGNEKTEENVIRREIDIYPGDIFNRTKFLDVRTKIMMLNFFENVKIKQEPGSTRDKAVIKIDVEEKSTGSLNLGVGYGTDAGPLADVTLRERNLLGLGQHLSIATTLAGDCLLYTSPSPRDRG